jgi:hypothetical protein
VHISDAAQKLEVAAKNAESRRKVEHWNILTLSRAQRRRSCTSSYRPRR